MNPGAARRGLRYDSAPARVAGRSRNDRQERATTGPLGWTGGPHHSRRKTRRARAAPPYAVRGGPPGSICSRHSLLSGTNGSPNSGRHHGRPACLARAGFGLDVEPGFCETAGISSSCSRLVVLPSVSPCTAWDTTATASRSARGGLGRASFEYGVGPHAPPRRASGGGRA